MTQARTLFMSKSCAWPEISASTSPSGLHSAAMMPPLMAPTCSHHADLNMHPAWAAFQNSRVKDLL